MFHPEVGRKRPRPSCPVCGGTCCTLMSSLWGELLYPHVQFLGGLVVLLDQLNTNLSVTVTFVHFLVTLKMGNALPVHILQSRLEMGVLISGGLEK